MDRRTAREAAIQRELAVTAYHEAGHAVVSIVEGAPVHKVWIRVSRPLFGRPVGYGKTPLSRTGGTFLDGSVMEAYVTASLAGAEAEAMFLHILDGVTIRRARHQSATHNRGELDYAAGLLNEAVGKGWMKRSHTLDQAQAATRRVVTDCWPAIDRLAQELIRRPALNGREVRRIVGRAG